MLVNNVDMLVLNQRMNKVKRIYQVTRPDLAAAFECHEYIVIANNETEAKLHCPNGDICESVDEYKNIARFTWPVPYGDLICKHIGYALPSAKCGVILASFRNG